MFCKKSCCVLYRAKNMVFPDWVPDAPEPRQKKFGILIIDSEDRILITQSYNKYWGVPKGTKEEVDASDEDTCIRETKEESGIDVSKDMLVDKEVYNMYKNIYVIYKVKLNVLGPTCEKMPETLQNETSGCGWIRIKCLHELYKSGRLKLNFLTRVVLQRNTCMNWIR